MSKRRIKAVLFDLGETLLTFGKLDTGKLIADSVRRSYNYLKELNQPVGPFWAYRLTHLWGVRWHVVKSSLTGNDFDSLDLIKNYGIRKGFDLTDAQWDEMAWKWYQPLAEIGHIEPDISESLQKLKDMGLSLGLLSNTFIHASSLERHMAQGGFLDHLPVRMYTYQYPWRKPDVRIFEVGAEKMGVDADKIVYVGDRIDNDVVGAAGAGMLPVMKRAYTNEKKSPPEGVPVIETISQLPNLLAEICEIPTQTKTEEKQPAATEG
ncbi:MAG: HAD family hydrolase [Planctomycetota bacterium]